MFWCAFLYLSIFLSMHTSIPVGVRAGRPQFRAGPVREGKPFLIKSFVAGGKKRGGGGGVAWGYGGGNGRFGGGQGGANVIIGGGSNKGNGGYWGRR